jgi:glutamyl-tRNA synthetase
MDAIPAFMGIDDEYPLKLYRKKRDSVTSTGGGDPEMVESFALQNAIEHHGKANVGSVMGSAIQFYKNQDVVIEPRSIIPMAKEIVADVDRLSIEDQKKRLNEIRVYSLEKKERKVGLPELKGAEEGKLVMRFAPGPSGPLHIGHTRASILNDEYCKRYNGKFILRIEDTNPEKIDPEAYRMIQEDLEWLGIKVHETYLQSDRFEIYYESARRMLENGAAYVCTEDTEVWRELKYKGVACSERGGEPEDQLEKWDKMLDGTYQEGAASLVIKTDLNHKNPAVRDFVGMRIRDAPHPKTGDRYRVYPLYNLSVAIDDHLMGCTHILRGKDHLNNTFRQEFIYDHMGWDRPNFIHYGLVSIPDTILKTSLIRGEILAGNYSGWDDVRTGTLRALDARGFHPLSIRNYWIEVGLKSVDITFSWENLFAMNRTIIDRDANRYFYVEDPLKVSFAHNRELKADIPVHPEFPEKGFRHHVLEPVDGMIEVLVPSREIVELEKGAIIRLKDLCNIKIKEGEGLKFEYGGQDLSEVRGGKGRIIHWTPLTGVNMTLIYPDGNTTQGTAEKALEEEARRGGVVQLERVGYCRMFYEGSCRGNFTHP